ncbi:MAG: hypothetical protein WB952_23940 [Terriglobales bacterium]
MKKMLFVLSLGVMCVSLALAQDSTTTGQSMAPTDSSNNTSSVQGCLSGSDGNYMLTQDGTGTTYKLMGYENQLKKHVGHEVAVTGQLAGSSGSTASGPDQSQAQPPADNAGGSAIQVTNVKMISKQCSSAGTSTPQSH